jgi:Mn-dependent DtxR family transcriptional regulator
MTMTILNLILNQPLPNTCNHGYGSHKDCPICSHRKTEALIRQSRKALRALEQFFARSHGLLQPDETKAEADQIRQQIAELQARLRELEEGES